MADEEDVVRDLVGKSTVKRRKAAKAALTLDSSVCPELIRALEIEEGSKYWQTKVEIANALGMLKCSAAESILRNLVFDSSAPEFDMPAYAYAKALVRVARDGLDDSSVVWEIVSTKRHSITSGALDAVGYDRMRFDRDFTQILIDHCWDLGQQRPRGTGDPRYGLAAACAGWDPALCRDFLEHCLSAEDNPLSYVAKNSLEQKYVRLNS